MLGINLIVVWYHSADMVEIIFHLHEMVFTIDHRSLPVDVTVADAPLLDPEVEMNL